MNCRVCGGACCEGFKLQMDLAAVQSPDPDFARFLSFRHAPGVINVHLDIPCDKLCAGKCTIYADRPKVCHDFEVGGPACLHVLSMRRSPEQIEKIKNTPTTPEDYA